MTGAVRPPPTPILTTPRTRQTERRMTDTTAASAAPADVRPWTVSLQVHVWTSTTVQADDMHEAMALAEDEARLIYGDGIFIDSASTEVA